MKSRYVPLTENGEQEGAERGWEGGRDGGEVKGEIELSLLMTIHQDSKIMTVGDTSIQECKERSRP